MIVNVACKWGLTSAHYEAMTKAYNKWSKSGFEIIGVPCNQFKNQEPGSADEISSYAKDNFNSEFPLL